MCIFLQRRAWSALCENPDTNWSHCQTSPSKKARIRKRAGAARRFRWCEPGARVTSAISTLYVTLYKKVTKKLQQINKRTHVARAAGPPAAATQPKVAKAVHLLGQISPIPPLRLPLSPYISPLSAFSIALWSESSSSALRPPPSDPPSSPSLGGSPG